MAIDVLQVATNLLRDCAGFESDEVSKAREDALNYYFMRPRGDEQPGCSQVISGDVSAMVEANLAQMLDAFTTDSVVEFEPDGLEDENQAQLESDTVTHFVMDANNGFLTFLACIKDALLCRNGVVKVYREERKTTRTRTREGVTPEAYAGIQAQPGVEVEELDYDAAEGVLKTRETKTVKHLRIDPVPIENFLYTKNWTSLDLQRIPCCGERHVDIRSDLVSVWKFDAAKVAKLTAYVEHGTAQTARNPKSESSPPNQSADPSLDLVEWFELYPMMDTDGDGIAERHRTCIVPNQMLLADEEVETVCYAAGSALINPHRFLGISLFDKLKQVQDINTGLNRSLLDNANAANKSRLAYLDGKVEVEDLNNGLVNGNIRVKGSVENVAAAIMPFVVPDISAGILQNIEHQKRTRAELGGAALDLAQGQAQLSDSVGSQGVDRAYSVMEQLAGMMTRTIAESLIRNTYTLAHATLREHFSEPTQIKRSGKWLSATPSEWPERQRVNVKIGMSPGERARKVQALQFNLTTQLALSDKGMNGILVNLPGVYSLIMDMNRAAAIDNPERYFMDPASDESKAGAAARDEQVKAEKRAQMNLMNMALGFEQMRIALEKRNADADRVFKYFDAVLKAETKEGEIVGNAVAGLQQVHAQAQAAREQAETTDRQIDGVSKGLDKVKELRNGKAQS